MLSGQTHHVRGRLVGLSPSDRGGLTLSPEGEEQLFIGGGSGNAKPDGTFDFPSVAPGKYTLSYLQLTGEVAKGGRQSIEVGDQDVNDVVMAITSPASIHGRIRVENAAQTGTPALDFHSLHLTLLSTDALVGPRSAATIAEDGTFVVKNIITPHHYTVMCNTPPGVYIKSIRYGQSDLSGRNLELTEGRAGEMEVILRYGTAVLRGRVESSANGQADNSLPLVHVVLIPSSPKGLGPLLFATTQPGGTFSVEQIPPGHYRAYAFESIDFAALQEPPTLKALETAGTGVEFKEAEKQSISLRLISSEQEQQLVRLGRGE